MPSLQDLLLVLHRKLAEPAQHSWIVAVALFEPDRGEPDLGVRVPSLDVDVRRL
jgi:hypothetical protein